MYNDYRAQGYTPIAVNVYQAQNVVKTYARQYTFPFLCDASGIAWNLYNISGSIPLNYVIDTAQVVVGRMVGFTESSIRGWITPYLTGIEESHPEPVLGLALTATPSPASRPVTLRYSVERGGDVNLRVYSTAGTLVRTLYTGSSTGASSVMWNLTDASGRRVPNGLYVCELSGTAGSVRTTVAVTK